MSPPLEKQKETFGNNTFRTIYNDIAPFENNLAKIGTIICLGLTVCKFCFISETLYQYVVLIFYLIVEIKQIGEQYITNAKALTVKWNVARSRSFIS